MKLDIKTTKGTGLTDALRDFLQAQMDGLDPLVARFGESVTAEAEVGRPSGHHLKGDIQRAEVHVRLPGKLVYAEASGEDPYAVIREAVKEAARQIKDYRGVLAGRHRGAARGKE